MKKRLLAFGLAAGCTVLFTACDETTNTDIMNADAAATVDSLPECNKEYDGMLATIPSKGEILICTQGDWKNVAKTIATSSTPGSDNGSTAGCTAKTTDGGVSIVCDGKTVATLKNGAKGQEGDQGAAGSPGGKGTDGGDGSNGSSGKNFTLGKDDCSVHRMIGDVVIYDCGNDETYLENLSGYKANVKTWNALNLVPAFTNRSGSSIGILATIHFPSGSADPGEGKIERWEGDDAWTSPALVDADELGKNFAIKGKATLTVEADAEIATAVPIEPSVGAAVDFTSAQNMYSWGGVCLTYTAKNPMDLILLDGSKNVARAKLAAATKETTVNIAANQFVPDSADVKLEDINKSFMRIIVKAVGSLEEGEYENEFAIYELGAYKQCSGTTISDVEAWAKKTAKAGAALKDDRTDPAITYKTVTIGDQTWMAENLRLPYPAKTDDGDGDPDTDNGEPMALCPADDATAEELAKGCLYRWSAAMDSVGLYNDPAVYQDENGDDVALKHCGYNKTCALTAPVKGICPDGWHLPTMEDAETLLKTAVFDENFPRVRTMALRAGENGWLGFSMASTGYTVDFSSNTNVSSFYMWLATESSATSASYFYWEGILGGSLYANTGFSKRTNGLPVRCIKDQAKD